MEKKNHVLLTRFIKSEQTPFKTQALNRSQCRPASQFASDAREASCDHVTSELPYRSHVPLPRFIGGGSRLGILEEYVGTMLVLFRARHLLWTVPLVAGLRPAGNMPS